MNQEALKTVVKTATDKYLAGFSAVRYVYFGRTEGTNVHNGVTSVGYTISDDGRTMKVAVAFCSPEDIFSKKKTQAIIHGRISWGKTEDIEITDEDVAAGAISFKEARYEDIINIIRTMITESYEDTFAPENGGFASIFEFVKANKFNAFPSFAEVNFPWWFKGI